MQRYWRGRLEETPEKDETQPAKFMIKEREGLVLSCFFLQLLCCLHHRRRRLLSVAHTHTPLEMATDEETKHRVIQARTLVVDGTTVLSPGVLTIDRASGTVVSVASGDVEGAAEHFDTVVPGFVDLHTHGPGAPCTELLESWIHAEAVLANLCRYGATSVCAAVAFPSSRPRTVLDTAAALEACHATPLSAVRGRAVLEGVYAEGPVIATLGGLPDASSMIADGPEALLRLFPRSLRLATISPSVDAKQGFAWTRAMLGRGVVVAMGHDTQATRHNILGQMRCAAAAEVQPLHTTHLFNVMALHHRNVGIANFGLVRAFPRLACFAGLQPPSVEVIGDLLHLDPLTLAAVVGARDPASISLITDAVAAPDAAAGITYDGRPLEVVPFGDTGLGRAVVVAGTQLLTGSAATTHDLFRNAVDVLGCDVATASTMLSEAPARVARIFPRVGCLRPGSRGDFVALTNDLHTITCVAVAGRTVHCPNTTQD